MKYLKYILLCLPLVLVHSCLIENDMSYPRVYGNITAFDVEGQIKSTIDTKSLTVNIELEETADISNLKITDFAISEGAFCDNPSLQKDGYIDLSEPMTVTVSTYQEYVWTISANMPVERYVECLGQADAAVIDIDNNVVSVNVTQYQSLDKVVITKMKLGIEGSEIWHVGVGEVEEKWDFPEGKTYTIDCTKDNTFKVRSNGREETWTLKVTQRTVVPEILTANPWCYSADITAEFASADGSAPVFQYKESSADGWKDVSGDAVTVNGVNASVSVTGLNPETEYSVRLAADGKESEAVTFNTGKPEQLANMGFDEWYSKGSESRPIWYPNLNETVKIWDTANPGSGTFIGSLTTPDEKFTVKKENNKYAARLESKNALIAFAAGNIYTGEFGKVSGLGAILDWGTPFTGRPAALKGYYSYTPVKIDKAKEPYMSLVGTMDKCQILVMLTDWDEPFTVNTSKNIFVDQENDPHIIAYGKIEDGDTDGKYKEFTLTLEYRRPDATPKYAVVIACASYKGDYFTGGVGSTLYVDEFEFVYK